MRRSKKELTLRPLSYSYSSSSSYSAFLYGSTATCWNGNFDHYTVSGRKMKSSRIVFHLRVYSDTIINSQSPFR